MTEQGKVLKDKLSRREKPARLYLSLRYKLALPVLILVLLLLSIMFRATFRTVSAVIDERNKSRLQSISEVFAETLKVPLILQNQEVLLANIQWMAQNPEVLEVRVEDPNGVIIGGGADPKASALLSSLEKDFVGGKRIASGAYAVAVAIENEEDRLGRLLILFSQEGFETELRFIFIQRLTLAFVMAFVLALLIAGVTWLAILPIFNLKQTVQKILRGDLSARADITSYDEIQDLADAFNEMVGRLAKSLDNLRSRTEALEESEEKYRLIVEQASDIIFTLTPDGELSLLNKDFSGYNREEVMVEGADIFLRPLTPESREQFESALERVCQTKEPAINISIEHLHRTSQSPIFYLLTLTPMLDHEGSIKVIQGVMRDITELRRIEMMKDSLIRDVAHELKTPTAKFEMALEWFSRELEKKSEQEKYGQILSIMKTNADRLMRTIVSIMDMTKLESGMTQLKFEVLDLREVLKQVYQDMKPLCEQKGLALTIETGAEELPMRGDKDMLYRLFLNLVGNAIKFTPEKGVIEIKATRQDKAALVSVKDTGIGLDKQDMEKIFERFYQKTASSLGIGVGLAISRDIVRLHHGKIWADSAGAGKGAIFKVEFPIEGTN